MSHRQWYPLNPCLFQQLELINIFVSFQTNHQFYHNEQDERAASQTLTVVWTSCKALPAGIKNKDLQQSGCGTFKDIALNPSITETDCSYRIQTWRIRPRSSRPEPLWPRAASPSACWCRSRPWPSRCWAPCRCPYICRWHISCPEGGTIWTARWVHD